MKSTHELNPQALMPSLNSWNVNVHVMVEITLLPGGSVKNIKIEEKTTLLKILDLLNLPPDIVVIMKNNSPIPLDSIIEDKDKLKIVRVVSGG